MGTKLTLPQINKQMDMEKIKQENPPADGGKDDSQFRGNE